MRIEALAERLHAKNTGDGRWMARCPAHDDHTPSLSLRRGRAGRNLVHCFGGCPPKDIARATGLPLKELLADTPTLQVRRRPRRSQTITGLALEIARRQSWGIMGPHGRLQRLNAYEFADELRHAFRIVRNVRKWATTVGPSDEAWTKLAIAARLETEAFAYEANFSPEAEREWWQWYEATVPGRVECRLGRANR